jgi:hypothetical protein
MADITDPEAIKFSNEEIRPICETLRKLKPEIASIRSKWFGGLNNVIGNGSDLLDDGRESEGVSRLTGEDITAVVSVLDTLFGTLDANGVADRIQKPCVRSFRDS